MVWKFNDEQPIYQQIISQIKERIVAGEWKAGDKLKSVRELALEAGVNPNTMQKALESWRGKVLFILREQRGVLFRTVRKELLKKYISEN